MKKLSLIFLFIFLTGLFAGLFFSTNLSEENNAALSAMLLTSFSSPSAGFIKAFFASLFSNFLLVLMMAPALFTKYLCPLPPMVLWYKSFAIGFCCGLIYLNAAANAFTLSAVKILPQNLFLIPGFLLLSMVLFYWSWEEMAKKNRPSQETKSLFQITVFALALLFLGSITEGICHPIVLSP